VTAPGPPTTGTDVATPPTLALEHNYRVFLGGGDTFLGTFIEVTGLAAEYETYEYAEGGNNLFVRRLLGRMKYPTLTLKSGVTDQEVLLQWVLGEGSGPGSLTGPQDLKIDFVTDDNTILRSFGFAHAVPIKWTGPNASIGQNAVATEALEIAHHGLTRPL
jgi:phage tail-like protein